MKILLDDNEFEIIHRTNKKIKRISLILENRSTILLKTPLRFKSHQIKEIIYNHKEWILKSIKRTDIKNKFDFVTGGLVPFIGDKHPIQIVPNPTIKKVKLTRTNNTFIFEHNPNINEYQEFLNALKLYYKNSAKKIISPMFEKYISLTSLIPNKISYRYAKGRWGSCSHIDNISINYMLLQFPKRAIEYVVLHELCHIQEKNHSKRFYTLLSSYMSDFKIQENILKHKLF